VTSGNTADKVVRRHAEEAAINALSDTPVTILQGARQVGKSTLAQQLVTVRGGRLLSMDGTAARNAATSDPEGFVNQPVDGLFAIDEVQLVPALLRAVKAAVDSDRRPGRFLLTGSADLLHLPGANESLAGRAETVSLYGFSQGEILGRQDDLVGAVLAGGTGSPPSDLTSNALITPPRSATAAIPKHSAEASGVSKHGSTATSPGWSTMMRAS
jgi:predicted AAA+ superfamily ATPase